LQAVDFKDRALFTYERRFIGAFTFESGLNRLEFDRAENRLFFPALHHQVMRASAFILFLNHTYNALVVTYNNENAESAGGQRDEEGRDRENLNAFVRPAWLILL
jgi:hypothetical protein